MKSLRHVQNLSINLWALVKHILFGDKYTVFCAETPVTELFVCECVHRVLVTVPPSPLPRRHTLPSGCSCKACSQESPLCCGGRLPLIRRLGRTYGEIRERKEEEFILVFLVTHNEDACEHLTLHLGHEAQTLLKVAADAVQTQAELRVAAVLAGAASVVAHVQLVAAVGHSGDPEVKLGKERALLRQ